MCAYVICWQSKDGNKDQEKLVDKHATKKLDIMDGYTTCMMLHEEIQASLVYSVLFSEEIQASLVLQLLVYEALSY